MQVEVVTPHGVSVAGEADSVTAPGLVGEFGVLPGHSPFISALKPGVLRVRMSGSDQVFAVGRGYAEVKDDHVVVLVEEAIAAEKVDAADAAKKLAEAEQALKDWKQPGIDAHGQKVDDQDAVIQPTQGDLHNRIEWAQAQLNAKTAKAN